MPTGPGSSRIRLEVKYFLTRKKTNKQTNKQTNFSPELLLTLLAVGQSMDSLAASCFSEGRKSSLLPIHHLFWGKTAETNSGF